MGRVKKTIRQGEVKFFISPTQIRIETLLDTNYVGTLQRVNRWSCLPGDYWRTNLIEKGVRKAKTEVLLLHIGVLNSFCSINFFGSLEKPVDPFMEWCFKMLKINYIGLKIILIILKYGCRTKKREV